MKGFLCPCGRSTTTTTLKGSSEADLNSYEHNPAIAGASLVSRETLAEQHRFLEEEARHGGYTLLQHPCAEQVVQ